MYVSYLDTGSKQRFTSGLSSQYGGTFIFLRKDKVMSSPADITSIISYTQWHQRQH